MSDAGRRGSVSCLLQGSDSSGTPSRSQHLMHGNVERLPIPQKRVAVLLNGNARAVTEQLRRELEQFVPPEDLFFSRSFEDARSIARTVLDRGYATVLTGGGDGTFVGYLNCILEEATRLPPQVVVEGSTVRLA